MKGFSLARDSFYVQHSVPAAPAMTASLDERFRELLTEHRAMLERLAASYVAEQAEQKDLFQEIASAVWRAMPSFRGESSERTFIFRIAHNRAMTFITRRAPRTTEIDDEAKAVAATTGKNPAVRYERKEAHMRMLAAVRALPIGHRQVVTLMLEGLSLRDIASVTGTSEENAAVRATRARAALRVLMLEDAS